MKEVLVPLVSPIGNILNGNGWSHTFNFPIESILEYGDVAVVLLNAPTHDDDPQNVEAISILDGHILWKAPFVPGVERKTSYYEIARCGNYVRLLNWAGIELEVDPKTGSVLSESEIR